MFNVLNTEMFTILINNVWEERTVITIFLKPPVYQAGTYVENTVYN